MPYLCHNCEFAKVSTVKKHHYRTGNSIYYKTKHGEVIHRIKCLKDGWGEPDKKGVVKTKTLITIKNFYLPYCLTYKPMDADGAEAHRESLPDTGEEYEGVWKR